MAAAALGAVGVARAGTVGVGAQIILCPLCLIFDSEQNTCVPDPLQNGFPCNDANVCTQSDTC